MQLKFITFDVPNNTIEATFYADVTDASGAVVGQEPASCRNYSAAEKDQFLTDVPSGQAYVTALGW